MPWPPNYYGDKPDDDIEPGEIIVKVSEGLDAIGFSDEQYRSLANVLQTMTRSGEMTEYSEAFELPWMREIIPRSAEILIENDAPLLRIHFDHERTYDIGPDGPLSPSPFAQLEAAYASQAMEEPQEPADENSADQP